MFFSQESVDQERVMPVVVVSARVSFSTRNCSFDDKNGMEQEKPRAIYAEILNRPSPQDWPKFLH